ncbi:hypothetical protein PC129_g8204 [Phytophthora cactorum]|uniref:Uncharacterized protein n=1 Tax=Phytophthora cactorum TaxID=29920 RepID=A0A8T1KLK7_9STRA|nr:hypothetical protein Pcac1_g28466 [Phytophthora cactorum]KAG2818957.1 hypothetical protein PC112_g12395 [Phytophthora cactorum]KAG2822219.1 hypothetical protein PC111_g10718 [Phytophthora cactorum]KAG2903610.1 hypothetical protein PC114_g12201 [Phytophthora cactorum]KAG2913930.1 hypothetical protein PC115_g11841 [Phytophthora cactorum]
MDDATSRRTSTTFKYVATMQVQQVPFSLDCGYHHPSGSGGAVFSSVAPSDPAISVAVVVVDSSGALRPPVLSHIP